VYVRHPIIVGTFVNQPLGLVLESLARRLKVSVIDTAGMYFIGERKDGDYVSAVIRVPPAEAAFFAAPRQEDKI
jgi:hypothetical protein